MLGFYEIFNAHFLGFEVINERLTLGVYCHWANVCNEDYSDIYLQ